MDTPDRWDENPVDRVTESFGDQKIDTKLRPAVTPGQNVFAKEFVPNFGPKVVQPTPAEQGMDSVNEEIAEETIQMPANGNEIVFERTAILLRIWIYAVRVF